MIFWLLIIFSASVEIKFKSSLTSALNFRSIQSSNNAANLRKPNMQNALWSLNLIWIFRLRFWQVTYLDPIIKILTLKITHPSCLLPPPITIAGR